MRTIVAGSRGITNPDLVEKAIQQSGFGITEVVCGNARGVDLLGKKWAKEHNIPVKCFDPDWKRYGNRAGPLRNIEMSEYAVALIAIWDGTSPGTKNMIEEATKRGLKVFVLNINPSNHPQTKSLFS